MGIEILKTKALELMVNLEQMSLHFAFGLTIDPSAVYQPILTLMLLMPVDLVQSYFLLAPFAFVIAFNRDLAKSFQSWHILILYLQPL